MGQVLETEADGQAQLEVPALGTVEVQAYTRVELVAAGDHQQRLRLHQGALEVSIFAPPGKFFVETPSGTAVDLGCAYSVSVDPSGNGRLAVSAGWVGFRLGRRESLLPAGAECSLRAGQGPGTPRMADASEYFRRAVTVLDGPSSQEDQAFALGTVLSQARPQDAFTLWHLLDSLPPESRPMVLRRLVQLVPRPPPCRASGCWRASSRPATGCGTSWGWIPLRTGAAGRPMCADEQEVRTMTRRHLFTTLLAGLGGLAAFTALPPPARAGSSLMCPVFDIGDARSLPWGEGQGWNRPRADYARERLIPDTLELLRQRRRCWCAWRRCAGRTCTPACSPTPATPRWPRRCWRGCRPGRWTARSGGRLMRWPTSTPATSPRA